MNGGKLLYFDQDYFAANQEPEFPSFAAGDFAVEDGYGFYKDDPDSEFAGGDPLEGWWSACDALEAVADDALFALPERSEVESVFPNPFILSTKVEVTLTRPARLRMNLFNVLGRQAGVVADGRFDAGRYSFTVDGRALAAGIYFLRVEAPGQFTRKQKIALLP